MKSVRIISAIILVFAFLSTQGCGPSGKRDAKGAGAIVSATVAFLEGEVTIDGKEPKEGDAVAAGATIVTGTKSGCEIIFGEKNIIAVDENTRALISLEQEEREIDLVRGTVRCVLKKIEKIAGVDSFRVSTGNAVLGVRGTVFAVHAQKDSTYICSCNGAVDVSDVTGKNKETLTNAHHGSRIFTTSAGITRAEPDGLLYHADKDMEALASKIGYRIDWNEADLE